MKRIKRLFHGLLPIAAVGLLCFAAHAQNPTPAFLHLGLKEGLSQLSVMSISEDEGGCVWIGTSDGLNRIIGDHISTYRHIYNDPGSLLDDEVKHLSPTTDGSMLICTKQGVSLYLRDTDSFRSMSLHTGPACAFDLRRCPSLLSKGTHWAVFSERSTMVAADPFSGQMDTLVTRFNATCFVTGRDSSLYIGSSLGRIFKPSDHFKKMECVLDLKVSSAVEDIKVAPDGTFWIALAKDGLVSWNPQDGNTRHYTIMDGLSSNLVRELEIDDNGILWVATGNNITLLNPENASITLCEHDFNKPESLSSASVKTLCKDRFGALWIGTYYGGVDYYIPTALHFHSFILPEHLQSGQEAIIRSLSTDPDGSIWIGTSRSGVIRHDPLTGHFDRFDKIPAAENALNAVSYHKGGREVLLGCSMSGLSVYDKYKDRIVWSDNYDMVFSISQYDQNRYVVGGQKSLKIFDFNGMQLKDLSVPEVGRQRVFHTYHDSAGFLWIGLADRLIKAVLDTDDVEEGYSVKIVDSFSDIRQVQDILEFGNRLWFASKSGLLCYDSENGEWTSCSSAQGLSTNLIRGLEFDQYGYLWASTDRSLLWIDPESFAFQEYGLADGLINTKYNSYAHCKTADGRLWFGGTPGISWFMPDKRGIDSQPGKPFIAGLYVNGVRYYPQENASEIRLHQNERNITLSLARPEFFSKDVIEYKMEGVDTDWRKLDPVGKPVSYPYLPSGDNVFFCRTIRPFGHHVSETANILIRVDKYWYQTNWFFASLILILLSILVGTVIFTARHSRSEIESIRVQAEKDIEARRISSYMTVSSLNRPRDVAFMKQALDVMEKNLANEAFDVEQFARQMGMSRSNLHLRMKSVFGGSTTSFIRRLRIEKAMDYMQEGKLNISEISYAVGFSSATYFATAFKQLTGTTPTEWKQSYSGIIE